MKKSLAVVVGVLALAAPTVSAQTDVSDLVDGLTTFVDDATGALPLAATAGIDWSDAYIGSIVGVPPHFGVGIVMGTTTLPGKAVRPLVEALGGELPTDLPLPLAAVNARIGGFLVPFDVGLRVGVLPGGLALGDYSFSYQNFGIDGRWAFFQGEPALPTVSLGVGFGYLATGVKATYGDDLTFTGTPGTLNVSAPELTLDLSTATFEVKVQVSKSLLILTPYLGLSALAGSSTAEAAVSSDITTPSGSLSDWSSLIDGISANGFSQERTVATFGAKVFGGTSLNLAFVRFDLQGMYSLFDGVYGGTLGARFQL